MRHTRSPLALRPRGASRERHSSSGSALALLGSAGILALTLGLRPALAQTAEPMPVGEPPRNPLPEALLGALPLPAVQEELSSDGTPPPELPDARDQVEYNVVTGEEMTWPASSPPADYPDDPGYSGEEIYGSASGGSAPKTDIHNTTDFPWRTMTKIYSRFDNDWFECSGFLAGTFHLLTTGRCVHDGTDWADELIAYAGLDGQEKPFGEARGIWFRSYSEWVNHQRLNHNWAVVTLDRRLGDRVGWQIRTTDSPNTMKVAGYRDATTLWVADPALKTLVTLGIYTSAQYRIPLEGVFLLIPNNSRGGPAWKVSNGVDYAFGILSEREVNQVFIVTSPIPWIVRGSIATKLTSAKRSDLNDWIALDGSNLPPTDRPDLHEYNTQRFVDGVTAPGQWARAEFSMINTGYATSGSITVDFFLNDTKEFDGTEIYVGSASQPPLGPMNAYQWTQIMAIPATLPVGDYWLGWRIDGGAVQEYSLDNNEGWNWSDGYPITVAADPTCGTLASGDAKDGIVGAFGLAVPLALTFGGMSALRRRGRRQGHRMS